MFQRRQQPASRRTAKGRRTPPHPRTSPSGRSDAPHGWTPPAAKDAPFSRVRSSNLTMVLADGSRSLSSIVTTVVGAVQAGTGLHALGTPAVRDAAARVIEQRGPSLTSAERFVLGRLRDAGVRLPTYADYAASDLLTSDIGSGTPRDVTARTAQIVTNVLAVVRGMPALADHPNRAQVDGQADSLSDLCLNLSFSHRAETVVDAATVRAAILPESDIPDEILFQAVVQISEVCFASCLALVAKAVEAVVHDEAAEAALAVHHANNVLSILNPALRLITLTMSVNTWLEFRPLIVRPSAIQSARFQSLLAASGSLRRVSTHRRFPRYEAEWIPRLAAEHDEMDRKLQGWRAAHLGVARLFTPGGGDGISWLENNPADTDQVSRS